MKKVVFCLPTLKKPYQVCLDSLGASIPHVEAAGWEHFMVSEVGCPYISSARATMLRKALDIKPDAVVFIDHDLSWEPNALPRLLAAEGDVVAATYRFKRDEEEYMGALLTGENGKPLGREDGCILAHSIPAGFLKITAQGVNSFMWAWPELCFGPKYWQSVDLFNHGAHEGVWYGEDYAFARRWRERCGDIWLIPDVNIAHHTPEKVYPGNYHEYLLRLPGGAKA